MLEKRDVLLIGVLTGGNGEPTTFSRVVGGPVDKEWALNFMYDESGQACSEVLVVNQSLEVTQHIDDADYDNYNEEN